jgi:hypothetical protein
MKGSDAKMARAKIQKLTQTPALIGARPSQQLRLSDGGTLDMHKVKISICVFAQAAGQPVWSVSDFPRIPEFDRIWGEDDSRVTDAELVEVAKVLIATMRKQYREFRCEVKTACGDRLATIRKEMEVCEGLMKRLVDFLAAKKLMMARRPQEACH